MGGAFKVAVITAQHDAVALANTEGGGLCGIDVDSIATSAGERIHLGVDHRVELFAAPGGTPEFPRIEIDPRSLH